MSSCLNHSSFVRYVLLDESQPPNVHMYASKSVITWYRQIREFVTPLRVFRQYGHSNSSSSNALFAVGGHGRWRRPNLADSASDLASATDVGLVSSVTDFCGTELLGGALLRLADVVLV